MVDDETPNEPDVCWACCEPLKNEGQKKCLECEVWQTRWRRFASNAAVIISLLVGLGGVIFGVIKMVSDQSEKQAQAERIKTLERKEKQISVSLSGGRFNADDPKDPDQTLNVDFRAQNSGVNFVYMDKSAFCKDKTGNKMVFLVAAKSRALEEKALSPKDVFMVSEKKLRPSANTLKGGVTCSVKLINEYVLKLLLVFL